MVVMNIARSTEVSLMGARVMLLWYAEAATSMLRADLMLLRAKTYHTAANTPHQDHNRRCRLLVRARRKKEAVGNAYRSCVNDHGWKSVRVCAKLFQPQVR